MSDQSTNGGPMSVACPNCNAPAGKPCTRPTQVTRVPVAWFHAAREDAYSDARRELPPNLTPRLNVVADPVTVGVLADPVSAEILARAVLASVVDDPSVTLLACDCGFDLEMHSDVTATQVRELIEHVAYDHPTPRQLDAYRTAKVLDDNDLREILGITR